MWKCPSCKSHVKSSARICHQCWAFKPGTHPTEVKGIRAETVLKETERVDKLEIDSALPASSSCDSTTSPSSAHESASSHSSSQGCSDEASETTESELDEVSTTKPQTDTAREELTGATEDAEFLSALLSELIPPKRFFYVCPQHSSL
eukprot:TRINITY_DN66337_c7_g1_i2.p1 TRINITY_DN66337_c7_g1~~TRINITY_DN66337_c7_g1_i2.p1  ORF type:complete len:148 (-),score=19.70 TRINITY_DN66337_c7_g1_i2:1194-1637(-)